MKKYLILLATALYLCLLSCSPNKEMKEYKTLNELTKVDSFSIPGLIDLPQDLVSLNFLNDSVCYSLELMMRDVCIYKDSNQTGYFELMKRVSSLEDVQPPIELLTGATIRNETHFIVGDNKSHSLNVYNEDLKWLSKHPLHYNFPNVGSDYFPVGGDYMNPVGIFKDTLVVAVTNQNNDEATNYFREKIFMEFVINGDSLSFAGTFGEQHTDGIRYYLNDPLFTWEADKAWVIYPAFDTVYTYKINTENSLSIPIHNRDFKQPDKWEAPSKSSYSYIEQLSKYTNENFRYKGIVFDKHSGHLVLWYKKAEKSKAGSVDFWYALVMDQQGHILDYYKINSKKYFPFIFQTPKGLAVPKYQNNYGQETRVYFDVFQF